MITTVDIASVARAITDMVKDSEAVQTIGVKVERAEPVNTDPSRCPWVGIYPIRCTFPTRTLGLGAGYRGQDSEVHVFMQTSHPNDGEACQDALGTLAQAVTSVLLSDPTLKGTVLTIGDFDVTFDDYAKVDEVIMQTAVLRIVGLTTVGG